MDATRCIRGEWLAPCRRRNLVAAGFYDIAVRDVVMSLAAFTLARLAEVRDVAQPTG